MIIKETEVVLHNSNWLLAQLFISGKGEPELIKETIEKGYDIVNSYHIYTYLDYDYESIPLQKSYEFNPIPEGLTEAQQSKVLGIGCQMWGEFIPTVESMNKKIYPRLAAYAEVGWTNPSNKDLIVSVTR